MDVTLTDEQTKFVKRRVATGKNRTEREVVDEALRVLHEIELEQEVGDDAINAAIEEGVAQLRRGERKTITDIDAYEDEVMDRAQRILDARKTPQTS